ncbi:hypothetical protein J2T02_002629 [Chitinophaga terrae (ex Kim and Jung 2007)]|uniref:hypothetical protein n=1 Tax=Chitinophaga terrae (ex Kim and Jung 2007) TaxID=408074 RepID=UPI0027870788|nr:hypothetical protein [Chitinophaga terrae (ex Kim and Jung 2007)]MDQ0107510.1 hypothetical protein [Chitinophaga terrae (ex Kim and Jung 2007)]
MSSSYFGEGSRDHYILKWPDGKLQELEYRVGTFGDHQTKFFNGYLLTLLQACKEYGVVPAECGRIGNCRYNKNDLISAVVFINGTNTEIFPDDPRRGSHNVFFVRVGAEAGSVELSNNWSRAKEFSFNTLTAAQIGLVYQRYSSDMGHLVPRVEINFSRWHVTGDASSYYPGENFTADIDHSNLSLGVSLLRYFEINVPKDQELFIGTGMLGHINIDHASSFATTTYNETDNGALTIRNYCSFKFVGGMRFSRRWGAEAHYTLSPVEARTKFKLLAKVFGLSCNYYF